MATERFGYIGDPAAAANEAVRMQSVRAAQVRIVVANDHAIIRAALRSLLENELDFRVIGEARTAAEAVAIVAALKPDLVLLDTSQSETPALATLDALRGFPASRIILLSTSIDRAVLMGALRRGARGVVLKDTGAELLFKSIRAVMRGEYWIPRGAVGDLVEALSQLPERYSPHAAQAVGLTARERHIVSLVVAGHTNREISQKLTVTADTVKHHLTSIFDKTGASNRLELALFALHRQLVDEPTGA